MHDSQSHNEDALDLTAELRVMRLEPQSEVESSARSAERVLLLSKDSSTIKWATRWLRQYGLQVETPDTRLDARSIDEWRDYDAMIVDSSLSAREGGKVYQRILAQDDMPPVLVIASSTRDLDDILDARPLDILRKPFNWELNARRVVQAVRGAKLQSRLEESEAALSKALSVADRTRIQLRSRESYDMVTGLPNKRKFKTILTNSMQAVRRDGGSIAVFVIGFTRFRLVVEVMGQKEADLIVNKVGATLAECLTTLTRPETGSRGMSSAVVGSLEQARFGLMLNWSGHASVLADLQHSLMERLAQPFQVAGQAVNLLASLGVALYPQDADDVDSLLQRADNAMRDAQSRGGGIRHFCAETDEAAARKLRIEHLLHEALNEQRLTLAYQPIVSAEDGRLLAAEALLRWKGDDGDFFAPDEFVPIAEESGQMIRMGAMVLDLAIGQLAEWHAAGIACPYVCINLSRTQLLSTGFVKTVEHTLRQYQVDPTCIEFEISERGVFSGDEQIIGQLHELKALGVRLSLDDFGTGESAIGYLKELPIDVLKIDKSYIAGINANNKDAALTSAMVALGQRLDLLVIAEGVETQSQLDVLRQLGCEACQGYLFSRPLPAVEFAQRFNRDVI
ncbi:MAG: EAL domain-containing protein [Pseudomonadota bacterium]